MPLTTETFTDPDGTLLISQHHGQLGPWSYWEGSPAFDPPLVGGALSVPSAMITSPHLYVGGLLPTNADWEISADFDEEAASDGLLATHPDNLGAMAFRFGSGPFGAPPGTLYNVAVLGHRKDYAGADPGHSYVGVGATLPTLICRMGLARESGNLRLFTEPVGGGARTYLELFWHNDTTDAYVSLGDSYPIATWASPLPAGLVLDVFNPHTISAFSKAPYVGVAADPATSPVALGAWSPAGVGYVGRTATATLTAKDASGNPITAGGETVSFGGPGVTVGTVTDHGDGTYTATVTAATPGAGALTATIGGVTVTTTMPGYTVLAHVVTMSPSAHFYTGRTATVTVIGGGAVTIAATGGVSVGATTDHGDGTYTATATAITAGAGTVQGLAITVLAHPGAAARGARSTALVYDAPADVARWAAARQYALRFGLGGSGRWQRVAVVHGATVRVDVSDVNYFALYALQAKAQPVKQRTETF